MSDKSEEIWKARVEAAGAIATALLGLRRGPVRKSLWDARRALMEGDVKEAESLVDKAWTKRDTSEEVSEEMLEMARDRTHELREEHGDSLDEKKAPWDHVMTAFDD